MNDATDYMVSRVEHIGWLVDFVLAALRGMEPASFPNALQAGLDKGQEATEGHAWCNRTEHPHG